MSRRRRHELAGAGQVRSLAGEAWIQPVVAAGSLLALLLAPAARAGEVSATQGPLDLGTRVNGVAGGRCQGGQCEVTGGTAAGANLFHRFNRFDTRGEIRGVSIQNGVHSTVVLGVLDPMGSFLNKGISLSSPAHLFFLSPGGLQVGAGAQFFNTPRLTLSTASSLGLGSGRFEVFRTTAAEAALLAGMPIRGKGGLGSDPAEAQRNGLTSGGDLVVDGGLIQVDEELLLDAQGANLLLQAGSQLAAPGGSVELSGKNVTVAAGVLVSTSAQAPAAPVPALGTTTAPATATVVPAAAAVATTASSAAPALAAVAAAPAVPVALPSGAMTNSAANSDTPVLTTAAVNPGPTTAPAEALASTAAPATTAATTPATPVLTDAAANSASATSEAPALPVPESVAAPLPQAKPPAPAQISAAGLDGGVIRISASSDAVVAGQLKALGVAATGSGTAASGTVASGGSGKGGRIEVTGQRVTLTAAALDASGPAGGGTVLLGGDVRGANPAVPNASSTTVDAASTVRADALAKGDGGTVVLWSEQQTSFAGTTSARGGPSGGDGGFLEVSSKGGVGYSGAVDAAAPTGKAGSVLFDPKNIIIDSSLQFNGDAYWDSAKGSVVLTPSAVNKSGSFFYDTAKSLADDASFSTSFQFQISESKEHDGQDGADGLVFVIKNSNAEAIGGIGGGLGYKDISNSLGIEFDTYSNYEYFDLNGNHVGINLNGIVISNINAKIDTDFNNKLPWTAWIDYNNQSKILDVRLANNSNSRPDSSVLSYILPSSLKDIIGEVNGSSLASFGFTAATGAAIGKHEILSWSLFSHSSSSFSLNPSGDLLLQPAQIQTILNQGTDVVLLANNDITLKPNSSITIQSSTAGSGGISMQAGRSITLQSPITYVGNYSGPINLIANDTSLLPSFRDIGAGNLTVDTGANLTSSQALVSLRLGPGNDVYSPGVLQVNAPISASTVLARGSSGITLSGAAVLTASAPSGRAITLDAGSGAFLNNSTSGAAALSKQPGATWAIYTDNPTSTPSVNLGGLPYSFKQYNQTFDTNQGSNPILGSGNGLFFANSPTLSVNLAPTPQVSKSYDGTDTANLVGSNYNITGASADDTIIINNPSGAYNDKNVGTGKLVSVSELSITSATDTATAVPVYGYILGNSTANASIGTITKAPLTITAASDSRVYNGTTSSSGVPAVTSGQVFSGDMLSGLSQVFDIKNVLGTNQSTLKVSGGYTLNDGNNGNNYAVSLATASGTITPFDLSVTGLFANNKVYDATTAAPLGGSAAVSPFSGDEVTVRGTAAGAFSDKNVGIDKAVTVTGVTIAGNDAGNYNLLPLTNLKAAITPATLQISASSDSKFYDGSTQSSLAPKITQGSLWGDDRLTGLAQTYESKNALGAGQSKLIVSAYTLSDGNNGGNYVLSFLPGLGTINRASVTPSFTVKSKQYDGNVAAEIAGDSLQGGLASDELFMVGASALFDNASAGNDKLVTITGYTLSGQDANNYQLSSPTATSTASITTQQGNDSSLPNDEPIKNEQANPTVGLQLSTLSSATASKSVDVDISNIVLLPPGASALESTPAGSTQSQPTPSATAVSATSSVPNQTQPTASATAVTADSATQEYQESDNRSAEDAKTSLGLSNAPTSEAMSPARLQLVMQSAASFIRKYPARMPNQ